MMLSRVAQSSILGKSSFYRAIRHSSTASLGPFNIPKFLEKLPPTKVTTLNNGLTVATEENLGQTAAIGVFVRSGSVLETKENNGICHFLEHMAFKGTTSRTRSQIDTVMEDNGVSLNAYTSREMTCYTAKGLKDKIPLCLEVLADITQNSTFNPDLVEHERSTILREMEEIQNSDVETMFDYLHAGAFQGTSLGQTILGPVENIQRFTQEDLIKHVKTYYTAPRIVVAAAGAVKHEDIVRRAESLFKDLPSVNNIDDNIHTAYTGAESIIRNDELPYVTLGIGVEGVSSVDPDLFTAMIFQTLIGSWDRNIGGGASLTSHLAETVAEHGLAHAFAPFVVTYDRTGLMGIQAQVKESGLYDFINIAMNEFLRIGDRLHVSELELAKKKLKASLLMSLDGSNAICDDIGRQLLSVGRRLPISEWFLRIDDITLKDVARFMNDRFWDVSPVIYARGPTQQYPNYGLIKANTFWTSK